VGIFVLDDIYNKKTFMNRKIIITEEQYKKLKFRLLESTFDVMANKVIRNGDTITITSNGKEFNFKVIDNYGGQIYMDNVDDGTKVFLTKTSFQNNNLEIHIAQNDEQKNQNPPKGDTWGKMVMKNVEKIDVSREGKLIDGTEIDPKELEKEQNKGQEKVKEFIDTLLEIKPNEKLTLDVGNQIIELLYNKQESNKLFFTLSEDSKAEIDKDDNIEYISILLDEKEIKIDNNGLINLKLTEINKDNSTKESEVKIDEWTIDAIDTDDEKKPEEDEKEEDPEEEDKEETEPEENEDFDKDTFVKMLTGDAQLRMAYYKNPSKWQSFFGELTGKKQKGTGFAAIQDILRTYSDKKLGDKFGDSFLRKGEIWYELLEKVEIPYENDGRREYFTFNRGEVYKDNESVRRMGMDSGSNFNSGDYNLKLYNKQFKFEIIVTDITDTPNVFLCDIVKLYYTDKTEDNPIGVLQRSEPIEDINIRFLDSPGYKSKKEVKK